MDHVRVYCVGYLITYMERFVRPTSIEMIFKLVTGVNHGFTFVCWSSAPFPPNFFIFFETEGRHASAKAQEAVHHLASFPSSREEISQPGFEPPTSSLRFGYPSTITR